MSNNFQPLGDAEWPPESHSLKGGFATKLNVYRTMAHSPALLNAWAPLRDHVVVKNALGRQFSEVVILRTGHRMASTYEWSHHVSRARACGMNDERIASIAGPVDNMERDDSVFARGVDELFDGGRLAADTQREIQDMVGVAGLFDVIATVGFYTTLGFIVNSFDTPVDDDVAAELAERPLAL